MIYSYLYKEQGRGTVLLALNLLLINDDNERKGVGDADEMNIE